MARFELRNTGNLLKQLEGLGNYSGEIQKKMVDSALPSLRTAIESNFDKIPLSDRSTGALRESLKTISATVDKNGTISGEVGFTGKDENGVRNGLKAGVLEYGKSDQPARPFLRPAVSESSDEVMAKMQQTFNNEINKL